MAQIKHILRVSAALFLQTPSCRVAEVKYETWTSMPMILEVVPDVNIWIYPDLLLQGVHIIEVLVDLMSRHQVMNSVFSSSLSRRRIELCNHHINDDILFSVHNFEALLHSGVQVDVPSCAPIHEKMVPRIQRRKNIGTELDASIASGRC